MCGIIGYVGNRDGVQIVLEGLRRLEYRGYDSAGLACITNGVIKTFKCKGKIKQLESLLEKESLNSNIAIGHTRWATHGKPSYENAHPHVSGSIAIVHNGIIENYIDLKSELLREGHKFLSETDTEVIAHLISKYREKLSLEEAVREAVKRLIGSFALVVLDQREPEKLIGVRMESPLVVGVGEEESFIASDVPAFLNYCNSVVFLDDGEIAVLSPKEVRYFSFNGEERDKQVHTINWTASMAEKGGYKHFMLKEIHEQPRALADTIRGRILPDASEINYDEIGIGKEELKKVKRIYLVACGTSYHACLVGKYTIESIAQVPVEVDIASEFRYRKVPFEENSLFIAVSQSGETADTLGALREAKKHGIRTLAISNVLGSTIAREADGVFYTHSGPEISVASTKAFTSQILALYILTFALLLAKSKKNREIVRTYMEALFRLPRLIEEALRVEREIQKIAKELYKKTNFLYLGRGLTYPLALEGALKLKELSYIHAEGYAAGEMKHGPIALVEEGFPVVFITSNDFYSEKTINNMEEIKARDGFILTFTTSKEERLKSLSDRIVFLEGINSYLDTVIFAIPLQLLAYYIADMRGCDVDQPRNLAKSVTVE